LVGIPVEAGALAVDRDDADLGRADVADPSCIARYRGRTMPSHASRHRRAEGHVDRRQLVLRLYGDAAERGQPRHQPFESRRRRDR
jgi:hypothetical protein